MESINLNKYENSVFKSLDKENMQRIIKFLINKNCAYINELLEDYLDIFTFSFSEFEYKFNELNKKYNNNLINAIKDDMNILEEFYLC